MGRKKSKVQAPTPPPIVEAPSVIEEADIVGQEGYADKIQDNQMTMQSTLLTQPQKLKKKKPVGTIDPSSTMLGGMY